MKRGQWWGARTGALNHGGAEVRVSGAAKQKAQGSIRIFTLRYQMFGSLHQAVVAKPPSTGMTAPQTKPLAREAR